MVLQPRGWDSYDTDGEWAVEACRRISRHAVRNNLTLRIVKIAGKDLTASSEQ